MDHDRKAEKLGKEQAEILRTILAEESKQVPHRQPHTFLSKADWIASFNEEARKSKTFVNSSIQSTTFNFTRKSPAKKPLLSSLQPICITELEVGKVHRSRALYCKIVSRILTMKASTVLVEDCNSDIVPVAVYGLSTTKDELREGRNIVVLEPFFKLRMDNSTGIRVDDPNDLVYDKDASGEMPAVSVADVLEDLKRLSVEERLKELLLEDVNIGTQKLHKRLIQEGYRLKKNQVKALKASIKEFVYCEESRTERVIPIISERRPERDRLLCSTFVVESREKGNAAFKAKQFAEAEKQYSEALDHKNIYSELLAEDEGVHLWQLYGNRCAARLQLGKIDEAMQDSLLSNMCAPEDAIKPLLRCAEAMVALGMHAEMKDLLEAAKSHFPDHLVAIKAKQASLTPTSIILVGNDRLVKSIAMAIDIAPPGAEIVVDPGIYEEPLVFTKPVTLRCAIIADDYAAIRSLEGGNGSSAWAHIRVNDSMAIRCHGPSVVPIRIVGFRIEANGSLNRSWHALYVDRSVVILRNCVLTGSSGPICAAENLGTRLIMQSCAVHGGPQGGILVLQDAIIRMQQVHCCRHAACGLELRKGGSVNALESHFYSNGRQGIIQWNSAGSLNMRECDIHSNPTESGALIEEAKAEFESCRIYGNGAAGVVAQKKGTFDCRKCEIHDNHEGILIQDTGNATISQCDISSNRANGVFVGYDHRGYAKILGNHVHNNRTKGILVGNLGNVVLRGNTESQNRGLPPMMPGGIINQRNTSSIYSTSYAKRIKKNRDTIEKAFKQRGVNDLFDAALIASGVTAETMMHCFEAVRKDCWFCKKPPVQDEEFTKCARCSIIPYCSRKCQKLDWKTHKTTCTPKAVKYPTFLDPQQAV